MKPRASIARSLPPVYAAAAVRVAFPLLVLPVMAARLGVEEFGRLGLCLVWASLLSLVVEGGFLAAATRHAVTADADARRQLARQIFTARCVLSVPVALVALAVGAWLVADDATAATRWETAVLLAALACALGWPATWYLQATSQLHRWAVVDLVIQGLLLAACLLWARSLLGYLLLQSLAQLVSALIGWAWVRRELDLRSPRGLWAADELGPGLRLGGAMLPVSILGSAYSLALPAVAASQLGRAELGLYYLADRIVRALIGAAEPLVQLVYPRIVDRFRQGLRPALAYALRWSGAGAAVGLGLAVAAWLAWPRLQGLVGGDVDPQRLQAVLAVAGWLIPLAMGWRFIGYWMLGSARYDVAYRSCIALGAAVGLLGAWAFGSSAVALAVVALSAELAVMAAAVAGMLFTEWRHRR